MRQLQPPPLQRHAVRAQTQFDLQPLVQCLGDHTPKANFCYHLDFTRLCGEARTLLRQTSAFLVRMVDPPQQKPDYRMLYFFPTTETNAT